jgi:FMN-dependent NADH-azoreductase
MKTLIVHHTARTGSHTKALLDYFAEKLTHEVEWLDVANTSMPVLNTETTDAYVARNFAGAELANTPAGLQHMDTLRDQLIAADHVVMAFPMYNFTMPAGMKAWVDSVTQAGVTFTLTPDGPQGALTSTKGLVISTSGSDLSPESTMAAMEHSHSLAKTQLGFIGIDATVVYAHSTNHPDNFAAQAAATKATLDQVAADWND